MGEDFSYEALLDGGVLDGQYFGLARCLCYFEGEEKRGV